MVDERADFVRPGLHHLALTVSDLEASIAWYEALFAISYRMEAPHSGGVGRLLTDDDWSLIIVLHRHETNDGRDFTETVIGLDHAGFGFTSRAELAAFQSRLVTHGVVRTDVADRPLTQSPIADTPYGSILVFRDPDNIQLEGFAPPGT
ncbi:MAG TPA: VOC family protein [Mycobacterium sp.]|nr:VOC family protein [Mycobacterium sp.]